MQSTAAVSSRTAPPRAVSLRWPWILLPGRMALFVFFQALIAAGFALGGIRNAWHESAAWWPVTVTLTNLTCLGLLVRLYRQEGRRDWDIFRIQRKNVKGDLLALLGLMVITGPVSMLPNTMLAAALYEDALAPVRLFLAPLPPFGLFFALVMFPITQGLVELAFYFVYIMPRLARQINPWLAYLLAAFFLGIQHLAIPLRLDPRFMLWRGVMYIPFAFLVGGAL